MSHVRLQSISKGHVQTLSGHIYAWQQHQDLSQEGCPFACIKVVACGCHQKGHDLHSLRLHLGPPLNLFELQIPCTAHPVLLHIPLASNLHSYSGATHPERLLEQIAPNLTCVCTALAGIEGEHRF